MRIDLVIRDKSTCREETVILYTDYTYCIMDLEGVMNDFLMGCETPPSRVKAHVLELLNHEVVVEKQQEKLFHEIIQGVLLSARFDEETEDF